MIRFLTEGVDMPVKDELRVSQWISAVARGYGFGIGEINYIFCDDKRILEVNRQFLNHDYYTDIITFDYSTSSRLSGDIYISIETVRSNADEYGKSDNITGEDTYTAELLRILIHGILHLTGQGDKTEESKAEMTRKENAALRLYSTPAATSR